MIKRTGILAVLLTGVTCATTGAQEQPTPLPLFASDEVLELTLRADFSLLKGDRDQESPERPASVVLTSGEATSLTLEAQLRTRGKFRLDRANCSFPPLRLNLKKQQVKGTVFEGQDKLKIVGSCRPNRDSYEQLVLNEYLAYRSFGMLTPASFQVRLARITYVDESGDDDPFTRLAFLIEDDDALATRLGARVFELPEGTNLPPQALDVPSAATMAVFQYMIGNTDWSDVAGHNVEILDLGGIALPVPYDFDFSGIVDAPYSTPDPSLNLHDVRERLYRGWCWEGLHVTSIVDRFRDSRESILALYGDFPYLDDGERSRALDYLGAFFDGIETDERAHRRMFRDCRAMSGG
ncbi:MAG: hypothetical protein P8170_07785 [Gemmatimonadota bacterium]|jgi:hypothetical protein